MTSVKARSMIGKAPFALNCQPVNTLNPAFSSHLSSTRNKSVFMLNP